MWGLRKILAIGLVVGGVMLGYNPLRVSIYKTDYVAGNGYPGTIISKQPSLPRDYSFGAIEDMLFFYVPVPDQELVQGVELETILQEKTMLEISRDYLKSFCVRKGLIGENDTLTEGYLLQEAGRIFDELNLFYGTARQRPSITFRLDEINDNGGMFDPVFRSLILYRPDQAPSGIRDEAHELSHDFIGNEELNALSTQEILIRIGWKYGEKYLSDISDTGSGRSACLYGLAAYNGFVSGWWGIIWEETR
jgi:hypothetical protein